MATGGSMSVSVQGDSEETFDYICSSCKSRNNKIVEATHYCADCKDLYCMECLEKHKNHNIFGRSQVKKWGQQKSKSVPTEQCTRHSGNVLEMFCSDHDVLCCSLCISLEHRQRYGMRYIPEFAKGIDQSSEIQKVNLNFEKVQSEMRKLITKIQEIKATLDESKTHVMQCIKDLRKRVDTIFDELEKDAIKDMEKYQLATNDSIRADAKTCDDYMAELQQMQQNLQTSSRDNGSQLFIKVKKYQKKINEGDQIIQSVSSTDRITSFSYEIDLELEIFLASITNLGKLEMRTTHINIHDIQVKKQEQIHPYKLQNEREYTIKIKEDKTICSIVGCCQMPDGSILLADRNNKKLKQLNSSYQVTNHCDLPTSPEAVCCISPNEAAVSDNKQTIHFLNVRSTKMALTRSIKMDHTCLGLANNNSFLYISDGSNKVYIYDTSGKLMDTLHKHTCGERMFSSTRHIAVSIDGSKIYVADKDQGLVTLTTDGRQVSLFRLNKALDNARGVCVDGQGSVFVSSYSKQNITQLDGTQELQVTSVKRSVFDSVKSICVDIRNSTIIVTFKAFDSIKVYDLA